jgi:hypothetical protein
MKASEIIADLSKLVAQHGDLETLYECKGALFEIDQLERTDVVLLGKKDKSTSTSTSVFLLS